MAFDRAERSGVAGAALLSSPGYNSDLLTFMQRIGFTVIRGVLATSEVILAKLLEA